MLILNKMQRKPHTLFTPGPSPVPDVVMDSIARPVIYHRSEESKQLYRDISSKSAKVFGTQQPVMILTSSATGACEAAVTSLHNVGDMCLVINNGRFAQRWAEMLRVFGLNVIEVSIPWGSPATPEDILPYLNNDTTIKSVWIVHCETSSGTVSDIEKIATCVRNNSTALVCVDAVSSVGVHPFLMDRWGVDAVFTGSQKGLMTPPGLSLLALSERAIKQSETSTMPHFYFDIHKILKSGTENLTPWTPAVMLMSGLSKALDTILEEGLDNVYARHLNNTKLLHSRLLNSGYSLFSNSPSNGVTAVLTPQHDKSIVSTLANRFGITVSNGQDEWKDKIFRIGHLGYYDIHDIDFICSALEDISKSSFS
jgi:serine---pyruvate transaminase